MNNLYCHFTPSTKYQTTEQKLAVVKWSNSHDQHHSTSVDASGVVLSFELIV